MLGAPDKEPDPMIYLASPYWHENPAIRNKRLLQAQLITRVLILRGMPVFSPIVHGRGLDISGHPVVLSNTEWVDLDLNYISHCSSMIVAQLDGWQHSKGVTREMAFCSERNIPFFMLTRSACDIMLDRDRKKLGLTVEVF